MKFEISYNKDTELFAIHDYENQEIIIIRKEQLEGLLDKYCEIFGRLIV